MAHLRRSVEQHSQRLDTPELKRPNMSPRATRTITQINHTTFLNATGSGYVEDPQTVAGSSVAFRNHLAM